MTDDPADSTGAAGHERPALKRELGLPHVALAGLGVILGAGIYALIGEASAEAGALVWLSFLIAASATVLTGLSYAELAARFPRAGAGYEYAREAFGIHVAFVTGWLIVVAETVGAATVALGFGGYLEALAGLDQALGAVLILAVGVAVAATGVLGSVRVAIALTIVEVSGLLLVSAVGLIDFEPGRIVDDTGPLAVLSGAALVFFAYIGFEDIATLSEEARDPARTVPRAILISVALATALYVLVAASAVGSVGADALAGSSAPLTLVVDPLLGQAGENVLGIIALAATSNTALLLMMAACRHIYGMASTGALPSALARVSGGTRVPVTGLTIVGILAAFVTLWGDIGAVADVTNFSLFIAFAVVNVAVVRLRRRAVTVPRTFVSPGVVRLPFYGPAPLLPLLGVATLSLMLVNLKRESVFVGLIVLGSGLLAAIVFRRKHRAAALRFDELNERGGA